MLQSLIFVLQRLIFVLQSLIFVFSVCVCYGARLVLRPCYVFVQDKFVVVMSSKGVMYSQPVIPACNAVEGPVYFTIDISVTYPFSVARTASPQGDNEV